MRTVVVGVCCLLLLVGVAGATPARPLAEESGAERIVSSPPLEQVSTNNSTVFKRIETEDAGMVIDVDLSLLTNPLGEDTALRLVSGGTANGERVVWLDVGIGYTGGPVLDDPLDGFVTRADVFLNLPFPGASGEPTTIETG
jgi:hypothetical protein